MPAGETCGTFDAMCKVNHWIFDIANTVANVAFKTLKVFMINTDMLTATESVQKLKLWVMVASVSITVIVLMYHAANTYFTAMVGTQAARTPKEIVMETGRAVILTITLPYIFEFFLRLNNGFVEFLVDQGVNLDKMQSLIIFIAYNPQTLGAALAIGAVIFSITFLLFSIQYAIRFAELLLLFIMAPIVAITSINEDTNMLPAWWRESIAVIFMQSVQFMILWLIFNVLGETNPLNVNLLNPTDDGIKPEQLLQNMLLITGLIILILKTPSFLRNFLYSSGTGRAALGGAKSFTGMLIRKAVMKR